MAGDFFESASELVRCSEVVIDRPAGQQHQRRPRLHMHHPRRVVAGIIDGPAR
ncbi:MAG: hypothetical protein M3Y77_12700 [Actinomycetota bacterium]|nr:hypothetical protein [Actinomycetota bacterium]